MQFSVLLGDSDRFMVQINNSIHKNRNYKGVFVFCHFIFICERIEFLINATSLIFDTRAQSDWLSYLQEQIVLNTVYRSASEIHTIE